MATAGHDFAPYAQHLEALGLSARHVRILDGQFTGQAFITTDIDDNQITAFHPGAMSDSHVNRIADAHGVRLGIVSPDGRRGMMEHARDFAAAGIPFVFDPGQTFLESFEASLSRGHQKRAFGRIALHGPSSIALMDRCVVGTVRDREGAFEFGAETAVDRSTAIAPDGTRGRVAGAFKGDSPAGGGHDRHGHLVLRERARLVGRDDARRTQRFNG